jgi:hypothetical protein
LAPSVDKSQGGSSNRALKKKMRNASSLKVKGPDLKNDDNNVNRSISPISMKTSPVQDVYKPD